MAQIPTPSYPPPPPHHADTSSPMSASFLPPNKRQRLSPNPTSPHGMSPISPNAPHVLQSPTSLTSTNGVSNMPPQGAGAMGPPSRPVEKATDTAELTDVIAQSGINIRDEEKNLTEYFPHESAQVNGAFPSNRAAYNSNSTRDGIPSPYSNNLNDFTQQNLAGPTPFHASQAAVSTQSPEEVAQAEWKAALRRQAQSRQYHLNDPFLFANSLRMRASKKAYTNGIRLPQDGFFEQPPQAPPRRIQGTSMTDAEGTSITSVKAKFRLAGEVPLAEILTLLSLATAERIRGLVEDAAALAKGRRAGSHGHVPPEWSSLLATDGPELNTAISATEGRAGWESAVSPRTTNPLKRSYSSANKLPTPVSDGSKTPVGGFSLPNEFAKTLRTSSFQERSTEDARAAKRARKSSSVGPGGSSDAGGRSGTSAPSTPGPSTPGGGAIGERAPEAPEPTTTKKLSKKEMAKQQSARLDEAVQHKSANSTAAMMLGIKSGGLFGKKKTSGYSWMTGGAGGPSGANTPTRINTGVGGAGAGAEAGGAGGSALGGVAGRRVGEWREDRDKGAGIQMRDWASAVEADGKEQRSLASALLGLK
ncbi:MAG: hypothetical protein M1833_005538 [Piccolia ochrophora]|nr:MAG: hypothetical protein M1833_005538 [Piccolia ochrophora]